MVTIFQRHQVSPIMITLVSTSLQWKNLLPVLCSHQAFMNGIGDGFTEIRSRCPHNSQQAVQKLASYSVSNQNLAETFSSKKFIFDGRMDTKHNSWTINLQFITVFTSPVLSTHHLWECSKVEGPTPDLNALSRRTCTVGSETVHQGGNNFVICLHSLIYKIYVNLYKIWAISLTAHLFPIFGLHSVIKCFFHSRKYAAIIKFKIARISSHSPGLSEFPVISEEFLLNIDYRPCINLQKFGHLPFLAAFTKHFVK